jgi:hypothetical protein
MLQTELRTLPTMKDLGELVDGILVPKQNTMTQRHHAPFTKPQSSDRDAFVPERSL